MSEINKIPTLKEVEDYAMLHAENSPRPTTYVNGFMACYRKFTEPLKQANEATKEDSSSHIADISESALPSLESFAIESFKAIGEQTKRLCSGNASHLGKSIEGSANRAAEFIEKHYR